MRQLFQLISMPVGDLDNRKQARSHQQSLQDTDTENTRSPELVPPQAIISSQTLAAFSDDADEYEPTSLAFTYLIPHELSLLNTSVAQDKASTCSSTTATQTNLSKTNLSTSHLLFERPSANHLSINQKTDKIPTTQEADGDDEHLLALIPPELTELSITVR